MELAVAGELEMLIVVPGPGRPFPGTFMFTRPLGAPA